MQRGRMFVIVKRMDGWITTIHMDEESGGFWNTMSFPTEPVNGWARVPPSPPLILIVKEIVSPLWCVCLQTLLQQLSVCRLHRRSHNSERVRGDDGLSVRILGASEDGFQADAELFHEWDQAGARERPNCGTCCLRAIESRGHEEDSGESGVRLEWQDHRRGGDPNCASPQVLEAYQIGKEVPRSRPREWMQCRRYRYSCQVQTY